MSGRAFLQIPGPTNIPDRVLRAMDRPVIDHRSPEFAQLTEDARTGLRTVFGTVDGAPMLYPASGTGATEAALVNALRPGDRVLAYNFGHFSGGMGNIARKFGFEVDEVELHWGAAPLAGDVERRLRADDSSNPYQAILMCHNETSTGVAADIAAIHQAIRASRHEALFIVDTVSSLASIPFHMDDWGVDIVICGSQKGLHAAARPGHSRGQPGARWRWRCVAAGRRGTSGTGSRSCAKTASGCSRTPRRR